MATATETMHGFINTLRKYSESTGMIGVDNLEDAVRSVSTASSITDFRSQFVSEVTSTEKFSVVNERLKEVCGIIIGGEDTGAVISYNAGTSTTTVTAESIVPEDGDLSTAQLPTPGTTAPITYTGNDGKSFTFYAQWPDSFTAVYNCESKSDYGEACELIGDSRYFTDFSQSGLWGFSAEDLTNVTSRILRGLNTWWLRESAKLVYDSLGIDLDGKIIKIQLAGGGGFDGAAAATGGTAHNGTPSEVIEMSINPSRFITMDDNANGTGGTTYMDRVIAHELVHGAMDGIGSIKTDTPEFFREGIAEFVIGGDDTNAGHTEAIPTLAQDADTFLQNLAFADGYLNKYAYPAGYMFFRYLCKQTADNSVYFIENPTQIVDFNGNDTIINNFTEENRINYNTTLFKAYSTSDGKDFVMVANDGGKLVIRDVADKTVNFATGNYTAAGYMTSTSGDIGAADAAHFTAVLGANYKSNDVYAGTVGSYLWGGAGGNDNLFGGNGADTFSYNYGDGNDNISNAENQDKVFLGNTSMDQISSAQIFDNGVYLTFANGYSLNISGQAGIFVLENDAGTSAYSADYQNKIWTKK